MNKFILKVQKALQEKGFYSGSVDGIFGRKTSQAIIDFKRSIGLKARDFVGPLTKAALFENRTYSKKDFMKNIDYPFWFRVAMTYEGLTEYKGASHNPMILKWWQNIRASFTDDETPWCAGFVGGVLEECGIKSTRSAMARSYTRFGIKSNEPMLGCIVTFWRKSKKSSAGHVGFVAGRDKNYNLLVLGGNQKNAINILPFDNNRVLSYNWPSSQKMPSKIGLNALPCLNINKNFSVNEA